jgi:transposase
MHSRAYRATRVNDVNWDEIARGREGLGITLGVDVGKLTLWPVCRWADGRFERPWRADNPLEIPRLLSLIKQMSESRKLVVAMESSGTYGDALRQALADNEIKVERVSNKASHDDAEVFDGVPSQHDGKDAAVIADLAALGKSNPWDYRPTDAWEQELAYWVEWMIDHRDMLTIWQGRLEGLLGRHWPEATRVLKLSSVTLLRALKHYGSPQALAADPEAAQHLARWSRRFLELKKIEQLVAGARSSVGVRAGEWQQRQVREYAQLALAARAEGRRADRELRRLAAGHAVLQAQGKLVGLSTACVLWVSTGDPRKFYAAAAYRKAMGLNLVERSSGKYKGRLRLSKRGSARSRQWLYFAVLRLVQECGVRPWYEAKKARNEDDARVALVAVMRKLALALYHVGVSNQEFEPRRLFARVRVRGAGRTRRGRVAKSRQQTAEARS